MSSPGPVVPDAHERLAQAWLDAYVRSDPPTRRKMVRDLTVPIRRGFSIAWGPAFEKRYDDEAWAEALAELVRSMPSSMGTVEALLNYREELVAEADRFLGDRAACVVRRILAKLEKERAPDGPAPE